MHDQRNHDFEQVKALLSLPPEAEPWRSDWAHTQQIFDAERGDFLSPAILEEALAFTRMSPEPAGALRQALDELHANEALFRLAWHCHCLLFHPPFDQGVDAHKWPAPPIGPGLAGSTFYALVLLSGIPFVQGLHRARGVDEAITRDTLDDIEIWMHDYRKQHGQWGFAPIGWLSIHCSGRLYRLGRLQFEMCPFYLDVQVFRHTTAREIIILAPDGARLRSDGHYDGVNGIFDETAPWTARLSADESVIHGYPAGPGGAIQSAPVDLPAAEWERILQRGDPILSVHIPARGPMEHEACMASYRRALDFFPKHHPGHPVKALCCNSWLLDAQLAEYLPPASNILEFLRDWRLFPVPNASDAQTIERVFGPHVKDPAQEPLTTSLQRHIVEHMNQGRRWRNGAGLIFPEDLQGDATS